MQQPKEVESSPVAIDKNARLYAFRLAWRIQKFEEKYGPLSHRQKRFLEERLKKKLKKLNTQEESK